MTETNDGETSPDLHNLDRFLKGQDGNYERALQELGAGRKRSHWMWYIFPQYKGLASSYTSAHYAIQSRDEAKAYLAHPVLGPRLLECAEVLLQIQGRSAHEILGDPDDLKLRSSATLFALVSPEGSIFERLLDRYYNGERDERTLDLVSKDTRLSNENAG